MTKSKPARRIATKQTAAARTPSKSRGALPLMLADTVRRLGGLAHLQGNRGLEALVPARVAPAPMSAPEGAVEAVIELNDADIELDTARTIMALLGPRTASRTAITCALMRAGLNSTEALRAVRDAVSSGLLIPHVPGRLSGGWKVSELAS